jgi:hypothetical protein
MKITKANLKKTLYKALRSKELQSVENAKWIVEQSVWVKFEGPDGANWTIDTENGVPSYDMGYFWNAIIEQFEDAVFEPVSGAAMSVYKD